MVEVEQDITEAGRLTAQVVVAEQLFADQVRMLPLPLVGAAVVLIILLRVARVAAPVVTQGGEVSEVELVVIHLWAVKEG